MGIEVRQRRTVVVSLHRLAKILIYMRGSGKFCQRGRNRTIVLIDEVREKKRAIIELPAKRHLNGVSLAGRWWSNIDFWLIGSFAIFHGIRTIIDNEFYSFVIFQGMGMSRPPVPPLDPRMKYLFVANVTTTLYTFPGTTNKKMAL